MEHDLTPDLNPGFCSTAICDRRSLELVKQDPPHNQLAILDRVPFVLAAWYSCLAPFVVAAATGLFIWGVIDHPTLRRTTYSEILYIPILILPSSLVFGVVSLFGMRKHGIKPILLKAIIGILASLAFGLIIFALAVRSEVEF